MDKDKIELLMTKGNECIRAYTDKAAKASFLPFVSIPAIHSLCIAMVADLDKVFGVGSAKKEKPSNIALGVLSTPFMLIPVWGAVASAAYVETVGKSYLKALVDMAKINV